jgi:hypothetical protein
MMNEHGADITDRAGDQFNVILEAALRSSRSRAKASILYSDGRFASGIATADVALNKDNAPMMQLTINVGGCRAAGFDDVGAALKIAEWKPVEELEVLEAIAMRAYCPAGSRSTRWCRSRRSSGTALDDRL